MKISKQQILMILLLLIIGYVYSMYKGKLSNETEIQERDLIQKFLANDVNKMDRKKPFLWIPVEYEMNERQWLNFGSRNTTNLNQPYLYLTIRSIVEKCGDSFNICIIDDNVFNKLIPDWTIHVNRLTHPLRPHMRELAMAQLLNKYGGMRLPPSFVCFQDLITLYELGIYTKSVSSSDGNGNNCNGNNGNNDNNGIDSGNKNNDDGDMSSGSVFVAEMVSKSITSSSIAYAPNPKIMGCRKNSVMMRKYIEYLEVLISKDYTEEMDFQGKISNWFFNQVSKGDINIIKPELFGAKKADDSPVILDNLMSDTNMELSKESFGLYIPADDLIKRRNFGWFVRMSPSQVLESNTQIAKYLLAMN